MYSTGRRWWYLLSYYKRTARAQERHGRRGRNTLAGVTRWSFSPGRLDVGNPLTSGDGVLQPSKRACAREFSLQKCVPMRTAKIMPDQTTVGYIPGGPDLCCTRWFSHFEGRLHGSVKRLLLFFFGHPLASIQLHIAACSDGPGYSGNRTFSPGRNWL